MKKTIILLTLVLVCVTPLILLKSNGHIVFQGDLITIADDRDEDPCWFLNSKGFDSVPEVVVKSRQDREMYGYAEDIPIEKALVIFNEEQKCFEPQRAPLTEGEILAALGTSPDYGREDLFGAQEMKISKILSKRLLPKGSLLVGELSGKLIHIEDEFYKLDDRKTIERIYLFLDLDKKVRFERVDRSQIILIRKHYIDR